MPIRRNLRRFYGKEWRTFRAALIAERGARCSKCGKNHPGGRYLNLAHTTHDQKSSAVVLFCLACHNRHDARHRLATWRRRHAKRYGQLWLAPEFEWASSPWWAIPAAVRAAFADAAQARLF